MRTVRFEDTERTIGVEPISCSEDCRRNCKQSQKLMSGKDPYALGERTQRKGNTEHHLAWFVSQSDCATYVSQLFQGSWLTLESPYGLTLEEIGIGLADQSVCTAYKLMEKLERKTISSSKVFLMFVDLIFSNNIKACYERLFVHSYIQNSMRCFGWKRFRRTQQLYASNRIDGTFGESDHGEAPSPTNLDALFASVAIPSMAEAAWMKGLSRISSHSRHFLITCTEAIHWN
jgi:hypothetical protein